MNKSEALVAHSLETAGWTVLTSGWPDFMCVRDGQAAAIEVKSRYDTLRPNQKEMIDVLHQLGIPVGVARVDDDRPEGSKIRWPLPFEATAISHEGCSITHLLERAKEHVKYLHAMEDHKTRTRTVEYTKIEELEARNADLSARLSDANEQIERLKEKTKESVGGPCYDWAHLVNGQLNGAGRIRHQVAKLLRVIDDEMEEDVIEHAATR